MKAIAPLAVSIAVCATILFVPHHRREPDSFKPIKLAGLHHDLLSDLPTRWSAERGASLLIFRTVRVTRFVSKP